MSVSNKSKFFEVVTTSSVRANNKGDAMRIAQSRSRTSRSVPDAEVLGRTTSVDRIPAGEARSLASNLENQSN